MLTKRTSKNQITLPAALLRQLPETDYFDASVDDGAIVLRPVRIVPAIDLEQVRNQVHAAGAAETDVPAAIQWARS